VEKETGSSTPEEPFEIDWSAHNGADATDPAVTLDAFSDADAQAADLPVEPTPPWELGDADYDAAAALAALREFHLYGRREPHAVPDAGAQPPLPALLHGYRDLDGIRYDYPVCVTGKRGAAVSTLTAIVDGILSKVVEEGELGERRRHHVLRLEAEIRRVCEEKPDTTLSEAWDAAARSAVESAPAGDKRDALRESLNAARAALADDGRLLACAPDTPRRLFMAVAASRWEARSAKWRDQFEALVARTRDILAADDSRAADLHSPEHLRDSTAGEDMDFEAMSSLLKESRLGEPLPEARRNRIQRSLDAILKVKPLFDGTTSLFDASAKLPFDLQPVRNVCAAVVDRQEARMRTMVAFFKALRVAELEVENRYQERVHDRFFARFDASYLSADERALCPPAVLILDDEFFANPDVTGLLDLLSSGLPVNVVVELSDLGLGEKRNPAATPGWPARLAGMAAALGDAFVLQAPASRPLLVAEGCADAFDHPGPSLVCVYTGSEESHPGLAPYLGAAAAAESRLFPAFRFDPGRGETLAERMSIAGNAQPERVWTADTFAYRNGKGEVQSVELEFTPADFLSHDVRFDDHFWYVDASRWHEKMIPLGEFLRADADDAGIPYLTAVDADNAVVRVVVTRGVVDAVRRVGAAWRGLRESGGVDNSFARAALDAERARLAEEKTQEIAELEKKYAADLDRDLSGLTREIVARIAARLLSEGAGAPGAFSAPMPAPAAPKPAAAPATTGEAAVAEAPAAAPEEEEEAVSFNDPYIDTPLCTSCNECTKINSQLFAYDGNKQAFIKDSDAGTFRDLVTAAEKCPVKIIHPGKPRNESESGLDDLVKRAAAFN